MAAMHTAINIRAIINNKEFLFGFVGWLSSKCPLLFDETEVVCCFSVMLSASVVSAALSQSSSMPQVLQNFAPDAKLELHFGHEYWNFSPQLVQNILPKLLSAPHLKHFNSSISNTFMCDF